MRIDIRHPLTMNVCRRSRLYYVHWRKCTRRLYIQTNRVIHYCCATSYFSFESPCVGSCCSFLAALLEKTHSPRAMIFRNSYYATVKSEEWMRTTRCIPPPHCWDHATIIAAAGSLQLQLLLPRAAAARGMNVRNGLSVTT